MLGRSCSLCLYRYVATMDKKYSTELSLGVLYDYTVVTYLAPIYVKYAPNREQWGVCKEEFTMLLC